MPLPDSYNPHSQEPVDPVAEDENYFGKAPMLEPCSTPEIVRAERVSQGAAHPPPPALRPGEGDRLDGHDPD